MTKKIKHFKRWLALFLAVVLVGGFCIYSNSGSLWATEGVTPAPGEDAADTAEPTEVVSEPQEIILSEEDSEETVTDDTTVQPEDEIKADVPEAGEETKAEGEEETEKEETVSPETEEVKEEVPEEELPPEEEVEKVERSVKVVSSLEGVETVEEGTSITLTAELTGFDDVEYEIQWQRSVDGTNWEDVDGADDIEYTFDITEETDGYLWRVGVFTSEA